VLGFREIAPAKKIIPFGTMGGIAFFKIGV
jgi:hypothetical protein